MFIYNVARGPEAIDLAIPVNVEEEISGIDATLVVIKTLNDYIKAFPSSKLIKRREEHTKDFDIITSVSLFGDTIDLAVPVKLGKGVEGFTDCTWVLIDSLNEKLKELTSLKSVLEL